MKEVNRPVTIEDLKKGDEILVAFGGNFKLLRLTRTPMLSRKANARYKYSSLPCDVKMKTVTRTYGAQSWEYKIHSYDPDDPYTETKRYQLQYYAMWLYKSSEV